MKFKKEKKLTFITMHKIINDEFMKHNMNVSKNTIITWCYEKSTRRNPAKKAIPLLSKATGIDEAKFWADYEK